MSLPQANARAHNRFLLQHTSFGTQSYIQKECLKYKMFSFTFLFKTTDQRYMLLHSYAVIARVTDLAVDMKVHRLMVEVLPLSDSLWVHYLISICWHFVFLFESSFLLIFTRSILHFRFPSVFTCFSFFSASSQLMLFFFVSVPSDSTFLCRIKGWTLVLDWNKGKSTRLSWHLAVCPEIIFLELGNRTA